jgi:hypothetical protein
MRYKNRPHKNATYHLPGGQSDSLAHFNMRVRMNGLDIVFGSDTYSDREQTWEPEGSSRLKLPSL